VNVIYYCCKVFKQGLKLERELNTSIEDLVDSAGRKKLKEGHMVVNLLPETRQSITSFVTWSIPLIHVLLLKEYFLKVIS